MKEERSVLINLERFQLISGQKNFLTQQRQKLALEVDRLNILYKKNYFKKKDWKQKYIEKDKEIKSLINRYENEIQKYQKRVKIMNNLRIY